MSRFRNRNFFVGVLAGTAALVIMLAALVPVSRAEPNDDVVRFNLTTSGRDLYKLAIPKPIGDPAIAQMTTDVASTDLGLAGFFKVVDQKAYLANLVVEGLGINPQDWKNVGAEGVIKARATAFGNDVKLEFRLYEVTKGDQPVLSKDYRGSVSSARALVHQWCNDVVRYYTGEDGFFNSRIAFASSTAGRRRDIFVMDWDGSSVASVTTNKSHNMLPTWAPDGSELLFTSFSGGKPDLYAIGSRGGKQRVISARNGINTGGTYSPDGSKIAVTLSQDGNSEIYLLSAAGAILKRLTNNPFIDTSPSWSPDGSHLAFVSDRHGNPQIWMMAADGSGQTKLTRRGNYNQEPSWCPRKDQNQIAFTARDEKFSYDIFTVNVDNPDQVKRITEGTGSNMHPTWAPNGRALAYESTRGGIWISTADARVERQIYRGNASAPNWSPALKH